MRHAERIGTLSPKTKVSLGVVCACFLFFGTGIWKLAFIMSDLLHEVKEIHEAQSNFITVAEMQSWQGDLKYNLAQVAAPLGNAVPDIRVVVNATRKIN